MGSRKILLEPIIMLRYAQSLTTAFDFDWQPGCPANLTMIVADEDLLGAEVSCPTLMFGMAMTNKNESIEVETSDSRVRLENLDFFLRRFPSSVIVDFYQPGDRLLLLQLGEIDSSHEIKIGSLGNTAQPMTAPVSSSPNKSEAMVMSVGDSIHVSRLYPTASSGFIAADGAVVLVVTRGYCCIEYYDNGQYHTTQSLETGSVVLVDPATAFRFSAVSWGCEIVAIRNGKWFDEDAHQTAQSTFKTLGGVKSF